VTAKSRAGQDDAISALGNGLILAAAGSNVNLRAILHSIVAIEQGSFHRAANVIGTNQSVVSRRIRAVEDELGVSLFERDRAGVRPTAAGKIAIINVQHTTVEAPANHGLNVGDMVALSPSHPCTTLDKWRLIFEVDESYNVVGAMETFF
jgi:D-serine dehydratase